MGHFWNSFWKFLGIAVLAALVVSVAVGLITQSADKTISIVQQTFIVALGICGAIGLLVPVMLYFEDKQIKENNHVAE